MRNIVAALVALFVLSVIFNMFDPLQQFFHDMSINILGGDSSINDINLGNWRLAIELMVVVIILYAFQQGRRVDTYEIYQGPP